MIDLTQTEEYKTQKQQFDTFYLEKLQPVLQQNDRIRHRYLLSFWLLILMALIFYPYMLYLIFSKEIPQEYVGYIICASCLVVMVLCGPFYFYKKRVKPQIMPQFASFFGTFRYIFEGKIDDAILRTSDLFENYDLSFGDDYFTGTYEGIHISIAEEKLKKITGKKTERNIFYNANDKLAEYNVKNVFRGIFILFEMNKNFKGRTVVLKDKGTLGNAFNKVKGLQNIRLEDSLFEKYFEVYSDDQIEARYLLTTAFMERMLKLKELYAGKAIQFCFNQNTLLLTIPTGQDMFEANSFFRSNLNKKKIDLVFEQFYTIFSIVTLLKLNQKIGM